MSILQDRVRFYTYHASFLINGDNSGADEYDDIETQQFMDKLREVYGPTVRVVDLDEESYNGFGHCDYLSLFPLPGETANYIVHYEEKEQ